MGLDFSGNRTVICLLVINRIPFFPESVLASILDSTDSPVVIGYLREFDLPKLPDSPRVFTVKLELPNNLKYLMDLTEYQDFSQDAFYQLVQMKWVLLRKVLELGYEFLIYTDLDVYWAANPVPSLERTFLQNPRLHVLLQSFTDDPSQVKLCMGFLALRQSDETVNFISRCASEHERDLLLNPRVGDDDVVTALYSELGEPEWLRPLPQTTFPVGNLVNLFSSKNLLPGLGHPKPFIFHANYTVGIRNKKLLLNLFLINQGLFRKNFFQRILIEVELFLRRLRIVLNLGRFKKSK